jgi:hypothetical protein
MNEVTSLLELLKPGESALAVLTDGRHFNLNHDGSGSSGNWLINPQRQVERFIVYHRPGSAGDSANLYRADYVDATPSPESGRSVISFRKAEQVGVTRLSWPEFADTGASPVRYISKPASDEMKK